MACGRCPGGGNPPSVSGCGDNCFRVVNHSIPCADSSAPGASGSKDLALLNTDINGCSNGDGPCDVTYQLLSFSIEHFSAVTISEAGLLEWTLIGEATPNTLGVVRYRVFCNCNQLSASGKIYVCVKDLCTNIVCDEDFACNPETGICDPIVPNAVLT